MNSEPVVRIAISLQIIIADNKTEDKNSISLNNLSQVPDKKVIGSYGKMEFL